MIKTLNGFCPTQNIDYEITAEFLTTPSLSKQNKFIIGQKDCYYASLNGCELIYGDKCPLLKTSNEV